MFEIPIVFANSRKGAKHIFIDHEQLPYYLNLHQLDIIAVREAGLVQSEAPVKVPRLRVDHLALGKEYRQKLESSEYSTRCDLARSLGVSRAWITEVLNRSGKARMMIVRA